MFIGVKAALTGTQFSIVATQDVPWINVFSF
jgi:hypothetical protein